MAEVNVPQIGSNIETYNYSQSVSSLSPDQDSAEIPELSFSTEPLADAVLLHDNDIVFNDTEHGQFSGTVQGVTHSSQSVNIRVQSIVNLFNIEKTVEPYVGTLQGAVEYWCDLAGVTASVTMDSDIANRLITFPGWVGNMWSMVQKALSAQRLELVVDEDDDIVIREYRQSTLSTELDTELTERVESIEPVKYIDMAYYNHRHTGVPGMRVYSAGTNGGYFTAFAPQVGTTPLELRAEFLFDPTESVERHLVSKWGSTGLREYYLAVTGSGELRLAWSNDGTTEVGATSGVSLSDSVPELLDGSNPVRLAVRATLTNDGPNGDVVFFAGPSITGPWTSMGPGYGPSYNIPLRSQPLRVGYRQGASSGVTPPYIYKAQVRINNSLVASPDFTIQEPGNVASFIDAQSRTWSAYGNGFIEYDVPSAIYPANLDNVQIIQVDAGETTEVEIEVSASVISLNQPLPASFVADNPDLYSRDKGVYSIAGSDGLPVPPQQWRNYGGSLVVEKTEDPSIIRVIVTGAAIPNLAPFSIAMSSGAGNYYNSLHITGQAVAYDREILTVPTGAPPSLTNQTEPVLIDNPFVNTLSDAIYLSQYAVKPYSGVSHVLERTGDVLESGFGDVVGARVEGNDVFFRTETVSVSPESVTITAVSDTMMSDFEDVWDGATMADFEAQWGGIAMSDFALRPLRRD